MIKTPLIIAIAAAVIALGVFAFVTDAPAMMGSSAEPCANCHVMDAAYENWYHAPHEKWTECVDCHLPHENVFAYTNKIGDEKVIVIYNNSYEQTSGRIKNSFGKIYKLQNGNKEFRRKTISEALDLRHSHPYGKTNDDYFYIFKDSKTNLEYIRSAKELANEGLYAHLFGYNYHVFWNFREVKEIGRASCRERV